MGTFAQHVEKAYDSYCSSKVKNKIHSPLLLNKSEHINKTGESLLYLQLKHIHLFLLIKLNAVL